MTNASLYAAEDKITTKMGQSFLGERVVYRGKDLHHQLKDLSWLELYAFGITGRKYSKKQVKLLNFIWLSTSYTDKSIWPNQITALAGNYQTSPSLALSAGIAACDASIFGGKPFRVSIDFFIRCKKSLASGVTLDNFVDEEINHHKIIYGYGRPLASTDERVPHIVDFVKKLNLGKLPHYRIAIDVAKVLKKKKGLNVNAAALYAALGADLGFNSSTFHMFMTLCFVGGMPPGYLEGKQQQEGTLLPVRCSRLSYTGPDKRDW